MARRTAKHRRLGGSINGREGPGAPTIEQKRQNRLKLSTQVAAELKLDTYEILNKEYPILVDSLISIAKGKKTRTDRESGEEVELGDYKVIKQLIDLHEELYLSAEKILNFIDRTKAIGAAEELPTGVTAMFSTKAD